MRRIVLLLSALLLAATVFLPAPTASDDASARFLSSRLSSFPLPQVDASADEPVVRMFLFWSKTCPACHKVLEDILPPIQGKYGDQLEVRCLDVSQPANYKLFSALEEAYQVPKKLQGVPVIFVGQTFLAGWVDIGDHLDEEIQRYLGAGGVDYPLPASESAAEPSAPIKGGKPIHLAYFHQAGCAECDRALYDLTFLQSQYPQLVVDSFSIPEDAALSEWLGQHYGVLEGKRLTAPAVFVGEDYLLGDEVNPRNLQALVKKYASKGADRVWEDWEQEKAEVSIVERFRAFGVVTVIAAGLVDGVNPCAFATIIFFVSYLAVSGCKGKEILGVGSAFTLGVFLAYLLIGVGFWKFLQAIEFLTILGRWVYLLTAVLCLFLAFFSVLDYLKARRGEIGDMALNLPHGLRMRINRIIRPSRTAQAYIWTAFLTGLAVSIIELACTGQVYLPTLIFVMGVPSLRVRAFVYLLLYNLFFIFPLVVIFLLASYGTTSKELTHFLQVRAATIKLAMAGLFLVLAAWLFYTLA
ncbi:MAG: hypothetical protein U9R11_02110 [Chloroflexota bacterium]|nr:hypothetical protein [Chloroflexota bacterium]